MGHASRPDEWYDQNRAEWVVLLAGSAGLVFEGEAEPVGNHAKIGVSTGTHSYAIFGDMNQQGSLSPPKCTSSQNGRGGLFYVVDDGPLFTSVRDLIKGDKAPQ